MTSTTPSLFSPISYGSIDAKNRVVMAPLTRARATPHDGVPTDMMQVYYGKRASMGLIITEATGISREGLGWPGAPGIWSKEQIAHWKPITEVVHANGGKIICQLWHMGRNAHSSITGMQPVSCSPTIQKEQVHTFNGKKVDPERARELTTEDIHRIVGEYGQAALNAIEAGFDGVELHASHRYLIHEFMTPETNLRTDDYGGSIPNRLRFLKEVVDSIVKAIGADRVGVRFFPDADSHGQFDKSHEEIFIEAAKFLNAKNIAFLELRRSPPIAGQEEMTQPLIRDAIRKVFSGKLILNQGFTREEAIRMIAEGKADAISFGHPTLTNPDFYEKLKDDKPLTVCADQVKYLYCPGEKGYIVWD